MNTVKELSEKIYIYIYIDPFFNFFLNQHYSLVSMSWSHMWNTVQLGKRKILQYLSRLDTGADVV